MKNEHEAHGSGGWWGVCMLIRLIRRIRSIGLLGLLTLVAWPARAQWVTQTVSLKAGWNAVYLHVDPSHETLQSLVMADGANPITEVWMWAPPASTVQFVTSPQEPLADSGQWRHWNRNTGEGSLARLVPNAAYLVRVSADTATYSWSIKGKPVAPSYQWTTTGLNFIGFPTVLTGAPTWMDFIEPSAELQQAEVFFYRGGETGAPNPAQLFAKRTETVNRGQAYWLRAGTKFNRYFAPFELEVTGGAGLPFGDSLSAQNFRLRNMTTNTLTVTLNLVASEAPPTGQAAITGVPPLQLRGALNQTDLTYSYLELPVGTARTVTLGPAGMPGSDAEVVIGLDRGAMTGAEGSFYAGVLRLTDSMGFSRMEMPVTARVAATSGLWVGDAEINRVEPYLPALQRQVDAATLIGTPVVVPQGQELPPIEEQGSNVPRTFPVRLIVHNPASGGQAKLLQQVFYGLDAFTNEVVATTQSALSPAYLAQARRITSSNLPWRKPNAPWTFGGRIGDGSTLSTVVETAFEDHASNPFLHTYHPDHDNLDPTFKTQVARGMESYGIRREITLRILPPSTNVFSVGSSRTIRGWYKETFRLEGLARAGGTPDTRAFKLSGPFTLTRISDVPVLTVP